MLPTARCSAAAAAVVARSRHRCAHLFKTSQPPTTQRQWRRLSSFTAALLLSSSSPTTLRSSKRAVVVNRGTASPATSSHHLKRSSSSSSNKSPSLSRRRRSSASTRSVAGSAPSRQQHGSQATHPSPSHISASSLQQEQQQQQQQEHAGIFQSQHIKPFPVRAAIDIGTGGSISLCIARVDAQACAVQKLMYQTQLPLHLESLTPSQHPSLPPYRTGQAFTLSERTIDDITNKMRILHGAMRRNSFEGLSERAAVLSWPLCLASNAAALAAALTREFKVEVRVLGRDFCVEWPQLVLASAAAPSSSAAGVVKQSKANKSGGGSRLKALLRSPTPTTAADADHSHNSSRAEEVVVQESARAQLDTLAFLAHTAVSQCVAPQRLLVLSEDPQRGLRLLGLGTSAATDVADLLENAGSADAVAKLKTIAFGTPTGSASSAADQATIGGAYTAGRAFASSASPSSSSQVSPHGKGDRGSAALRLEEWTLPVDVATAHRLCITSIQRRPASSYDLHASSPNPLLSDEFASLRGVLLAMLARELPRWVTRKAQPGGMLVGTSHNGGLLNTAARVSQQTHISLEHLEVHAQHHFCGLTDVLLAETFPNPLLVLPAAALAAAVLRALESPRIVYVPEVTVAAALLVQPSLWLASRTEQVRARLASDPFYAAHTREQRGRVFARPHRKDNPTAAPDATWVRSAKWNAMSYEESMKGT